MLNNNDGYQHCQWNKQPGRENSMSMSLLTSDTALREILSYHIVMVNLIDASGFLNKCFCWFLGLSCMQSISFHWLFLGPSLLCWVWHPGPLLQGSVSLCLEGWRGKLKIVERILNSVSCWLKLWLEYLYLTRWVNSLKFHQNMKGQNFGTAICARAC